MVTQSDDSQIVETEGELTLMIEGLEKTNLKEFCTDRAMKWKFTTPLPHIAMFVLNRWSRQQSQPSKNVIGDTVLIPFEFYLR